MDVLEIAWSTSRTEIGKITIFRTSYFNDRFGVTPHVQGICVDPFPKNFERRTCKLHRHPVAASKENVTFISADSHGGIEKHVGFNKDLVKDSPRVVLETKLLHELLDESNAPPFIDYFSLDTEGSEAEILESFPFWKYKFGAITVEHNFEEPKRSEIRAILRKNGYRLYRKVQVDDWYMNNDYLPALPLAHKSGDPASEVLER